MASSSSLWSVTGLTAAVLLVMMIDAVLGHDHFQDLQEGPNVCSRPVKQNQIIVRNITRPCWKTEVRYPPCEEGYLLFYFGITRSGHHGHGRGSWRGKRAITTTTPMPTTTTSSYRTTTTSTPYPTTTTTSGPQEPYRRTTWWDNFIRTTTTPDFLEQDERCMRRIEMTCSFRIIRCITVTVDQYYCCPGYEPDGEGGCKLIIECSQGNGGCDQMCYRDDEADHYCGCFPGFTLVGETECQDIDECAFDNGGCSQLCSNTPGSFYCTCESGYVLTSPTECQEVNECLVGNGGCEQICVNKEGSHYCECESGFRINNGTACTDIDECLIANGGCSHECQNNFQGYSCLCPKGTVLDDKGYNCLPVKPPSLPSGDAPEPQASTVGEVLSRPIVYGVIIGGGILFLIIIVLICCLCRRRRVPPAAAATGAEAAGPTAVIFVAGKKDKKIDLGPGAEFGEKPPLDINVQSDDFDDVLEAKLKAANDYTAPPSVISYGSEPPPYAEDDIGVYEDVESIKDKKMEDDDSVLAFENLAYVENESNAHKENSAKK